jgi:hypothetical protein
MKLSQRLIDERAFVERALGGRVICTRCSATLETFSEVCSADLSEACPGFLAIEQCKQDFRWWKSAMENPS